METVWGEGIIIETLSESATRNVTSILPEPLHNAGFQIAVTNEVTIVVSREVTYLLN